MTNEHVGSEGAIWFYGMEGRAVGPVSVGALEGLARAGEVSPGTPMWREGMTGWVGLGVCAELSGVAGACVPPRTPGARPARAGAVAHEYSSTERMLLPVGRSPVAIVAGYLGLLSVLLIPAPFALVLGVLALVHIRRRPGLRGKGRSIFAIVMGAIFTVLLGVLIAGR